MVTSVFKCKCGATVIAKIRTGAGLASEVKCGACGTVYPIERGMCVKSKTINWCASTSYNTIRRILTFVAECDENENNVLELE